jgi:uncharacterized membrane protein YkvA (DUF1232 family)
MFERVKTWARLAKRDAFALYLAARDPRVPWFAKVLAAATAAYAFSPIDLIPDFIPVIGYLDDLIILPVAIVITVRLIPDSLMAELREEAEVRLAAARPRSACAAIAIVALWTAVALAAVWIVVRHSL